MTLNITDAQLPGLSAVDDIALKRMTGCDSVDLLRFRYRPGKRAVLHIKTRDCDQQQPTEGVVWLFAGGKAERLARRLSAVTFDESTGALYERFPADHRLPELQQFLSQQGNSVDDLIGGQLADSPQLLRYRPGISCTFSCLRRDGKTVYVKIIAKEDIEAIATLNQRLQKILGGSGDVGIAHVIGVYTPWRAIAYQAAAGLPLADVLAHGPVSQVSDNVRRVAMALERLSSVPGIATRALGRKELLLRAANAQRLIAVADQEAGSLASVFVDKMNKTDFEPRHQLIHGDMKLDHAFLGTDRVTFIDTESLSLGDPDYDMAKLDARLVASNQMGTLNTEKLELARQALVEFTSSHYAWFQYAAFLQTAKFFAQRPSVENVQHCRTLLERAL